jgi:hypothetical protein
MAIFESGFCLLYLAVIFSAGIVMLATSKGDAFRRLFGVSALLLGGGDAFHLIPRVYARLTDGLENHVTALGFGTLVTSITMTAFYVLVYRLWEMRFGQGGFALRCWVAGLAILRVALCVPPQNNWLTGEPALLWAVLRNVPFAALGLLIVCLFWRTRKLDKPFRFAWLAITLSFLFYLPVPLFADAVPMLGMLMLPKTVCYVWLVYMGFTAGKERKAV